MKRTKEQIRKAKLQDYKKSENLDSGMIDSINQFCIEENLKPDTALIMVLKEITPDKALEVLNKDFTGMIDTSHKFQRTFLYKTEKRKEKKYHKIIYQSKGKINFDNCTKLMNRTENIEIQNSILEHFIGMTLKIDCIWLECPNIFKPYIDFDSVEYSN